VLSQVPWIEVTEVACCIAFATESLYIIFLSHMADLFQGHYENESVHDYILLIQDTILFSFWKIMLAKCLSV